jgi:predicted ATPase
VKIEAISIKAYRALYDIELSPGQLTVLAGPNNAGKTTVATALDFLRETYLYGLEFAVSRKGGYENIAFRRVRRTKQPIVFDVHVSVPYREVPLLNRVLQSVRRRMTADEFERKYGRRPGDWNPTLTVHHQFAFKAASESIESDFFIDSESLVVTALVAEGAPEPTLVSIERQRESAMVTGHLGPDTSELWQPVIEPFEEQDFHRYLFQSLQPTSLLTPELAINPVLRAYERGLSGIQLYQLAPAAGRLPGSPTPNASLTERGENLPALVAYMQREHEEAWGRTLDAMRQILPDLVDIRTTFSPDRRLALQFVDETGGKPWNAEEMSDGTIQALSLFLVLYDPRQPFIIIEEPENSLHPWIVRAVLDTCRQIPNKQVIITTHSPALLSYVLPQEVVVLWREEGRSHAKRLIDLDPMANEIWSKGQANVFEILDGGFVRQAVPRGLT